MQILHFYMFAPSGGPDLQRNSSGLRRQSSQLRRPSFSRSNSDNSPSRAEGRADAAGLNRPSPQPQGQPQEQDLQAAWELEVWKNAEEVGHLHVVHAGQLLCIAI